MTPRRTFGAAILGVLVSSSASAQPGGSPDGSRGPGSKGRGGPMRIPVLLDLKKVAVGSWARYRVGQGGRTPRVVRQALVGRDQSSATVEVTKEITRHRVPPMASFDTTVSMMVVDLDLKEGTPTKRIVQKCDADPIEIPISDGRGRQRFFKLDPKKSLGSETTKVAAGTFQTQHYREVSPRGGTIDIWASTQVPPFGLVKMERMPGADAPAGRAVYGRVTYELISKGTGAKPSITKPAKLMDPAKMRKHRSKP